MRTRVPAGRPALLMPKRVQPAPLRSVAHERELQRAALLRRRRHGLTRCADARYALRDGCAAAPCLRRWKRAARHVCGTDSAVRRTPPRRRVRHGGRRRRQGGLARGIMEHDLGNAGRLRRRVRGAGNACRDGRREAGASVRRAVDTARRRAAPHARRVGLAASATHAAAAAQAHSCAPPCRGRRAAHGSGLRAVQPADAVCGRSRASTARGRAGAARPADEHGARKRSRPDRHDTTTASAPFTPHGGERSSAS